MSYRIQLRTKTSTYPSSLLSSDLSSRELVFNNLNYSLNVKDATSDTIYRFIPIGNIDNISEKFTWDSCSIVRYVNGVVGNSSLYIDWLSDQVVSKTSTFNQISNPVDQKYYIVDDNMYQYIDSSFNTVSQYNGLCCFVQSDNFNYICISDSWVKLAKGAQPIYDHNNLSSLQSIPSGISGASGYYHMDSCQANLLLSGLSTTLHKHSHSNLTNLSGGDVNGYYHLTSSQLQSLTTGILTNIHLHDHSNLSNLQGGTTNQFYHLKYIDYTSLTSGGVSTVHTHTHNSLSSIDGGDTTTKYHLSTPQYTGLTSGTNADSLHSHYNNSYLMFLPSNIVPTYTNGCNLPNVDPNTNTWYVTFDNSSVNKSGFWQTMVPLDCSSIKRISLSFSPDTSCTSIAWNIRIVTYQDGGLYSSFSSSLPAIWKTITKTSAGAGKHYIVEDTTSNTVINYQHNLMKLYLDMSATSQVKCKLFGLKLEY